MRYNEERNMVVNEYFQETLLRLAQMFPEEMLPPSTGGVVSHYSLKEVASGFMTIIDEASGLQAVTTGFPMDQARWEVGSRRLPLHKLYNATALLADGTRVHKFGESGRHDVAIRVAEGASSLRSAGQGGDLQGASALHATHARRVPHLTPHPSRTGLCYVEHTLVSNGQRIGRRACSPRARTSPVPFLIPASLIDASPPATGRLEKLYGKWLRERGEHQCDAFFDHGGGLETEVYKIPTLDEARKTERYTQLERDHPDIYKHARRDDTTIRVSSERALAAADMKIFLEHVGMLHFVVPRNQRHVQIDL